MDNEKTMEATAQTAVQHGRKGILKRISRFLLWVACIWAAFLIILQVALSPAVLTGIVNKFAAGHIDGDLSFSKVKVSMFRHFPNVGISIEDGQITYPADRFDSLEANGAQGRLLYQGCGEIADTLISFRHMSVGINAIAMLAGKISIPHAVLVKPRIFAHSYDPNNANWNIFRFKAEEDTTSATLASISIGRIRLTGKPHIVYTDSKDTIFAMVNLNRMAFDGRLDTRKASKNKIGLAIDSLMVAGRIAADTVGLGLSKLHLHEHHEHLDIHAEAKALLATRAFGRINIPISIKGMAAFPKDTVPAIAMNGFNAEIATIPIGFDAELRRIDGMTAVNARFNVKECKVEDMIEGFIKNFIPETAKIKTEAEINLEGTLTGTLGKGQMPSIDVAFTIPETSLSHKDIRQDINLALAVNAKTQEEGRIDITVSKADIRTHGLALIAKGGITDVMGEDPAIDIDGEFRISADSLMNLIPKNPDIQATGNLDAELKGCIRMSQMNIYNFGGADLTGKFVSDGIIFKSQSDTLDITIGATEINIGPETMTSVKNPDNSFRLLAINGSISKADLDFKNAFSAKGENISFSAKNSVKAFSDTSRIYPLGGHIKAENLTVADGSGMSVMLDNTLNSFQMVPKKDNPEVPVLSLSSSNKRIYLRDRINRAILTDAVLKGNAAMNTVERRLKRKAFMDSLSKAHPGIPRDSLMPLLRVRRQAREVPTWMLEEDFKAKDISFKLDGSIARYFREWDVNCDLDVRTGILMTPYMPLRNIIKNIDISLNNNELRIDNIKMNSGGSVISANGSLSGLRRALLGRGAYMLDLSISSDKMNADELLAAYNAGAAFIPPEDADKMAEASDSEFLQMVVADSLDSESLNTTIVVPANLNADIRLNAENISFSGLEINSFTADMIMKERCLQIAESKAVTNMGTAEFKGFYATTSKQDIRTGFDFNLTDVTTEKVIALMPAIDTIMPLLNSFKGLVNCEIAATASLDTCMNIITPSINGVVRIAGENLTMSDNEVFSSIAKKLKFKNSKEGKIDRMTVEGVIKDNTLEVFPFVVELDRYTLALSGLHNLDMSFKYHVSLIKSPMVFKIGVDLYGPDYSNMSFKIGKPKYKSTNVPVFSAVIDETKVNLAESIRNIFERGVDIAVRENERQEAIEELKQKIGYVNAAEQQLEELSDEEQKQLEDAQTEETGIDKTENNIVEIKDTLYNEQSGIH